MFFRSGASYQGATCAPNCKLRWPVSAPRWFSPQRLSRDDRTQVPKFRFYHWATSPPHKNTRCYDASVCSTERTKLLTVSRFGRHYRSALRRGPRGRSRCNRCLEADSLSRVEDGRRRFGREFSSMRQCFSPPLCNPLDVAVLYLALK